GLLVEREPDPWRGLLRPGVSPVCEELHITSGWHRIGGWHLASPPTRRPGGRLRCGLPPPRGTPQARSRRATAPATRPDTGRLRIGSAGGRRSLWGGRSDSGFRLRPAWRGARASPGTATPRDNIGCKGRGG